MATPTPTQPCPWSFAADWKHSISQILSFIDISRQSHCRMDFDSSYVHRTALALMFYAPWHIFRFTIWDVFHQWFDTVGWQCRVSDHDVTPARCGHRRPCKGPRTSGKNCWNVYKLLFYSVTQMSFCPTQDLLLRPQE